MRTAIQWILDKPSVVFSEVKGPGVFYPFELAVHQEDKLGAFLSLFCFCDRIVYDLNEHPHILILMWSFSEQDTKNTIIQMLLHLHTILLNQLFMEGKER